MLDYIRNRYNLLQEPRLPPTQPLTPAVLHILLALDGADRHGYDIMREVADATGGAVRMGPGTLYGTIKRMLQAGLIAEADERPDPAIDDARRRYYRLTGHGQEMLRVEIARLEGLVEIAHRKEQPDPMGAS